MAEKSTLSTAADSLLNLIKSDGEISFKDAAKKLNVSVETIESWAEFLQEGKMLAVKYKFMTPYAVPAGPGKLTSEQRKQAEIEKAVKRSRASIDKLMTDTGTYSGGQPDPSQFIKKMETKDNFGKLKNLLKSFSKSLGSGDFLVLDQIINDSLLLLRKNINGLLEDKNLGPQKKVELSETLKNIEKKKKSALDLLSSKKFDDASKLYAELKEEIDELSDRTQGNIREQKDLQVGYESIKNLFIRTHKLLSLGKVAEAADAYEEAERIIKSLSEKINREKSEIQEDIIRLNQDFTTITSQVREKKFDELSEMIKDFTSKAEDSLKKKDIEVAKQYYLEIEGQFREIPPGFPKEKEKLKKVILKLFSRIMSEERKQTRSEFDFFYKKIEKILKDSKKSDLSLEASSRMYQEVVGLFNKLPSGFIREKLEVQKEIIHFYDELTDKFEAFSDNSLRASIAQLNELITTMKSQIDSGDLSGASDTYTRINAIFGNLPKGFLDQKTIIQKSILDVYESLIDKKNHFENPHGKPSKNVSDIEKLLKELEKVITERNYPQAYLLYKKIKNVYNSIDSLGTSEKETLTERILAAYRKIVLLRNIQEEHSLELPPVIHVDPSKEVKEMIEDLRQRYKPQVVLPKK